ncbi:MAG: AraC family transcriptional regulator [Actinobacteria bacterium]|nr:AraC family transcriptional regulator [Actinomycetota bacterium]
MEAVFEQIATAPEVSWKVHRRVAQRFDFQWHFHPEYELTLVSSGTGRRFIGDSIREYSPGDLVIIGPELPHTYASNDDSASGEAVVVQFGHDFLGQDIFDRPDLEPIGRLLQRASTGVSFPPPRDAAIDITLSGLPEQPGPERTIDLLRVLLSLARARNAQPLASPGYRPVLNHATRDRLDEVCRYLQAHYHEPVTLSDVARVAHLSPAACSRFIRRSMGRTLTEYLNELRVGAACRLLAETDRQVADIASGCGYPNLANFNRQFRRLKATTPRAYRAAFR